MRVIFMGSDAFSLAPFLALLHSHDVVAVFTKPPKRKDRGMRVQKNLIHKIADERGVCVFTPHDISSEIFSINKICADIVIVVSYDQKIPKEILYSKQYGSVNIHPSLLPRYRGSSPIQYAILNRDKESGVCIIRMDENLDTGDILISKSMSLDYSWNFVSLRRKLSIVGSNLLLELLDNFHNISPIVQEESGASYAPRITKEQGLIDWMDDIMVIDAKIRALRPYTKFHLTYASKRFQIIRARIFQTMSLQSKEVGEVFTDYDLSESLLVNCVGGVLELVIVKPDNAHEVFSKDFINGLRCR